MLLELNSKHLEKIIHLVSTSKNPNLLDFSVGILLNLACRDQYTDWVRPLLPVFFFLGNWKTCSAIAIQRIRGKCPRSHFSRFTRTLKTFSYESLSKNEMSSSVWILNGKTSTLTVKFLIYCFFFLGRKIEDLEFVWKMKGMKFNTLLLHIFWKLFKRWSGWVVFTLWRGCLSCL